MSPEISPQSARKFQQWVQLDSKQFQEEQALLLEALSSLIDTSLSIATRLQRYRRYLLAPESQVWERT